MANKPFEIQGADLTLGGVNIQAGTTGVVIPGVTQAASYKIKEVNELDGVNQTEPFTPESEVVVIDYVQFQKLSNSQGGNFADFTATTDDEGYIDQIEVNGQGSYTQQEAEDNADNNMYAYNGTDPDRSPFVPQDWIQVPFRPKMTANEVENIGGGGSTGNFTFKADRITNETTASIIVGGGSPTENVAVNDVDELVPPGGVWRMFFLDADYLNLGTTVEVGDTVTTSWGTPITAAITDIVQDISVGTWALHFDQDITAEFNAGDTVTFDRGPEVLLIPTSKTWNFGTNGVVTLPNSMSIDASVGFGIVEIGGDDTRITIDNGGAPPGFSVTTNATDTAHTWRFGPDGDLTFPDGSIQTTAYTGTSGATAGGYLLSVGNPSNDSNSFRVVAQDDAYTYYFGNATDLTPGNSPTVIKVDSNGDIVWQSTIDTMDGTVTSAYVFSGTIYIYYRHTGTNVLYFVSLLAANGSVDTSISVDQTPDVITSRDTILGIYGGMPAYDATVGSVHFNGDGAKNGLIFGNGMGGNFNSAVEDDDGGDTEYFGIAGNPTSGDIYAVGYNSAYSSLVTRYVLGDVGASWHMNIDCGQVGGTVRATSVDYSNGYIYVVSNEFTDSNNGFLTKMDASTGAVIWQRGMGYGVSGNQDPMGIEDGCVVVDGNGDIVTAWNYGAENSQNNDILIVKFDTNGNMLWQRSLETADNESTDTTESTEFLTADGEHFYLAITARAGGPGISVGGAIKLPLDGSGTGSYGAWTYQSQSWSVATLDVAGDQIDRTANYTVNDYTIVPSSELNLTVTNSLSDSSIEVIQASSSGNTLVNGSKTFTLNDDGSITFPDGTRQTTAYPGATTYSLHEYNNPTTITTPTVVTIDGMDYAGGEVVQDTAFGVGSSRVTVYADSMFAMIGVNAGITTVYYNGETGLDSNGAKTVSSGIENYRGYYAYYNLLAEQDGESSISQIVISKSNTMSGSNRSTDTNNDDFTVSGLSGSDIIVVLNVYWQSDTGPSDSNSIDEAAQAFIDTVLFNDQTARTDINEMKAAFYAGSANIKTAIETYEGDLLYSGFEFYRNHQSVRPTGGNGIGAVLEISAEPGNGYDSQDIIVPGVGYRQYDYLNVPGTEFGGTSPANDVSIQVTAVDDNGGILEYFANGTVPSQVWPQSYIIDGDDDQYDIGNFIGTNMTRATATVTLTNEGSGDNPGDPKFIRLTVAYTDKPISLGQWCNLPGNEGCFINWAFPADTTVAELIGNGAQPRVGLKKVIYTNTSGYQGGEETSAMVGASNYSGFAVGDTITFRNGEVRTISDFDGDYIEWVGVVPGSTNNSGNNPRYPLTLTTSDYADITKSTVRIKPDAIEADSQDQYMKVYAGFNVVPPNPPLDNLHIHMAGGQENVELFLGTDNNFVSAKEAGNAPAAVNLKSENDINVINTNLRLTRKGSSWVSIYGDGENQNIRNQDPMGWVRDLAWNVGAVDEFGDYYIGGEALPESDATMAKFSRDGSLIWSKYNDSQEFVGWRVDGIAYHNGVVASLVHTDFDSDYSYYKLTEHDSATGVEISTYDIYDPDGDIYAAQMIHHSTLGWVVVGNTYGEGLTSSGLTGIGATGIGIIEIPKAGTLLGGAYPDSSGDWRISGGGFGSFKQQFDQGLGMYANVPVTTVTGVGTGARARVQVIYTSNTYSAFDFNANTGADYVTGDIVKIAGSYLGGGIDGGTSFAATPSSITPGAGFVTLNFDKTTYPTLFTQISSCTWTASYGGSTYTVNSVTDGSSVVGVVVDSTDANNAEVTFLTALGNDMRIVVNASAGAITGIDSSSGVAAPSILRFDAGYAAGYSGSDFTGGTFTVTRYQNGRAWVWNNSWTKYIEPEDTNSYTRAYSVTENPVTGGLVVGGYTNETIDGGALVWNLAANGTTSWIKTFGNFPEEDNPGGDDNIITGLAVDQMGQIYAANDVSINSIDANGNSMYRIEPTGMWGANSNAGISIQLEDDGKEYLYYGMPGTSVWGNPNTGFYLNKFTTNLEVVWGRYMDSYFGNISTNYYDANSPIIFGQGQVTMMGYGNFPVGNYANAILATISTGDEFVNSDANGWVLQNRADMAWASNNNYILKDYVTFGAQAKTGTVQSDSSGALAWTNYTYQSQLINFNDTSNGIVGVEQIAFVDGGVLDHNPSDIPPSIFFNPQAGNEWAYTLQLSDRGRFILNQTIPNVSECLNLNITVPSNKNVPFPVGTVITLINASSETAGGWRISVIPQYHYDGPGSVYAPKIWTTGGYQNPSVWGFYGIQTATLMKISTNAWLLTCNNPIDEDD